MEDVPPDGSQLAGPELPEFVGGYRILRELGRGGMGRVFLAVPATGPSRRPVALKVVRPLLDDAEARERFRRERQVLANLNHPGVAGLIDGGTTPDGRLYLVTEYVAGSPIDQYCAKQGLDIRERVDLFRKLLDAVEHAHARLVVHGDLKPANVLVDSSGAPRLVDFGIAYLLDPERRAGPALLLERRRFLTPAYASPEQRRGEALTRASDVYSLCAVLRELLLGEPPASEPVTTGHGPIRRDPRLPRDLTAILAKGLQAGPSLRYPSAASLADDLSAWREGRPVKAFAGNFLYCVARFAKRQKRLACAVLLVALATTAGSATVLVHYREASLAHAAAIAAREAAEHEMELAAARESEVALALRELEQQTKRAEMHLREKNEYLLERDRYHKRACELGAELLRFVSTMHREVLLAMEEEGLDPQHAEASGNILALLVAALERVDRAELADTALLAELAASYLALPRLRSSQVALGEAHAGSEAWCSERAGALTQRLIESDPSRRNQGLRAHYLIWAASEASRAGRPESAVLILEKALAFAKGEGAELAQSEQAANPAQLILPIQIDVLTELVHTHLALGNAAQTNSYLKLAVELVLQLDPALQSSQQRSRLARVYEDRAMIAYRRADVAQALADQEQALALRLAGRGVSNTDIDYFAARATYGTYLLEAGREQEALELLLADESIWHDLSLANDSLHAQTQARDYCARLGQLYARRGDWLKALSVAERRLELAEHVHANAPGYESRLEVAFAQLRAGQAKLMLGRMVEAAEMLQSTRSNFDQVLRLVENHRSAQLGLLDCYEALADVFGIEGSRAADADDQRRFVLRAIDALENAATLLEGIQHAGGEELTVQRTWPRIQGKLDFARAILEKIESGVEQEGSSGN